MLQILLVLALAIGLAWPLGRYLAAVMRGAPMRGDRLFGWIERPLYRLLGTDPKQGMTWRGYAWAFAASNLAVGLLTWILFMVQGWLPFNPDHIPNMRWDTALHTMVSFLTNTNQQHYSGQAQLSYLAQMVGIVGMQVLTPMFGLAMVVATLRGLLGGRKAAEAGTSADDIESKGRDGHDADVGNYWVDVIRATLRFMLPLCLAWSLLLTWQGVPSTLNAGPVATPLDASTGMTQQKIPLGPVAPMVAAKQLGSNGGGWYGPNSSFPLENPTPVSNLLEVVGILLIPIAVIFMVGPLLRRRKLATMVFGTMLLMSVGTASLSLWAESASAPVAGAAFMEGKEVRLGSASEALWSSITTQVNNGSVNAMHDSLAPLTSGMAMVNMLVNAIWGGIGCGLMQFLVYLMLAVFLAGLMTGRTPELFGRKIEAREVRLLALLILLQPIVILGFTALTLALPAFTGNSNPGFHGISQVFYEYTSAFANNGSGFEGLGDATYWWNLTCALVLALGRFPALIVPLAVAGSMARKRRAPESVASLQVETPTFAITLVAVIVALTLLQFLPVLVLGPVAEHLSLLAL